MYGCTINLSPANKENDIMSDVLHVVYIYKINTRGPNTEPCGTPQEMDCSLDIIELNDTNCFLLDK